MTFDEFTKPKFEVDFWLRHFKGLTYENSRAYEAYLMQPRSNSMFFADTTEYYDEDYIDIIDNIPMYAIEQNVNEEYLNSEPVISEETYNFIDSSE